MADCAYFSRRAKEENKKKAQRLQKDEWKEKEKEEEAMAIVEVEQDGYEKEHDNAAEWNDFWGTEIQNMDENDNWEDKDKDKDKEHDYAAEWNEIQYMDEDDNWGP